jgi:hypothetical protein
MNPFNIIKPIGGRLGFFDEDDGFEKEPTPNPFAGVPDAIEKTFEFSSNIINPIADGVKETTGAIKELVKGSITFQEVKQQPKGNPEKEKKLQEGAIKRDFFQRLEAGRRQAQYSKSQQAMEDLARMEVAGMSAVEKNMMEGLNADLKAEYTNNPYHINNIRNKKLEQIKAAKKQQQAASMAAASGGKNLVNSLDAQEGQSMISSSGAIASAG